MSSHPHHSPSPETPPAPGLPGYVLDRDIARSETSMVYLGRRAADDAPVAIKVLRDNLADSFHESFRAGSAIHARMRHASIVPLLETGRSGTGDFIVTPYLAGGDLLDQLRRGMSTQALFKYIKDIARALHAMHEAGYLHGDVKPANILFSSEGKAYLTDFDLASEISDESVAAGELFHASVEFSAPELIAGRHVDGRADLYSLGVVLYRALVGDVPYHGSAVAEIAQKHLQEPVPRLPGYLGACQPLIDRALAKRREQRFQDGLELVAAIDALRQDKPLPTPTLRAADIATGEIRAITDRGLLTTPGDPARTERQQRHAQRRRAVRRGATVLALVGALAGGGYVLIEQDIVNTDVVLSQLGIGDDPQLTAAWNDAQSLRQDTNQGLAAIAAAYRRVLAFAPDHAGARRELATLATDWKATTAQALQENNLELASTRLAEAREVFPNDLDWVQLTTEFQNRQRAERIMANTRSLLTSHGLSDVPSATAAIQSYQEVLRLAPEHAEAQRALGELGLHYATMASEAARRGEVNLAISLLERATAADRTLPVLDNARRLISQATTTQAAIEELLQQARRLRSQGVLLGTEDDGADSSAAELYHRVLAIDTNNEIASQGLVEITSQVAAQADQLLVEGALDEVEVLVAKASAAGLDEAGVGEIRRRMLAERNRLEAVAENLADARRLLTLGLLTNPPGDNAVARLREVQKIDPGNVEAEQMLRTCADRLASVAAEAHEVGLYDEAKQYLDLALAIVPDVPDWVALRDSWEGSP